MEDRHKFRAWDTDKKIMVHTCDKYSDEMGHIQIDGTGMSAIDKNECLVINPIFMQCTGLKDKNGKLIYEGDKLWHKKINTFCTEKDDEKFAVVEFHRGCYRADLRTACYTMEAYLFSECEIIGSIHENPELIKEK